MATNDLTTSFLARLAQLFHLRDQTDREGTIATITEGVEFRGLGLWSLIVAIFIASIGLNVNSTAVIIGAMLISPLMGPIMGAGMALGLYDTALLKKSLANLGIMTALSLATSFIYFSLSPLTQATPELLARTTPTFFDVLIALLGGTAMIVATSRKSRSVNAIAGVAIATALMPPLCTAGFGLARGSWAIVAGAGYLYLINSVFIGLTTLAFTKYLHLGDAAADRPAISKRTMALFTGAALVFLAPSVYLGWDMIQETGFRAKIDRFVAEALVFPESQIAGTQAKRSGPTPSLTVSLIGQPLSAEMQAYVAGRLREFGLDGIDLRFIQDGRTATATIPQPQQGTASPPVAPTPSSAPRTSDYAAAAREAAVLFPELITLAWGELLAATGGLAAAASEPTVLAHWARTDLPEAERVRLQSFLRLRLGLPGLRVVHTLASPLTSSGSTP